MLIIGYSEIENKRSYQQVKNLLISNIFYAIVYLSYSELSD